MEAIGGAHHIFHAVAFVENLALKDLASERFATSCKQFRCRMVRFESHYEDSIARKCTVSIAEEAYFPHRWRVESISPNPQTRLKP